MSDSLLTVLLWAAAAGQVGIAILGARIAKILKWEAAIAAMPLLVREVFLIHKFFLSYNLILFAVLTARFAPEIAAGGNPPLRWLIGGIALFWGIRTIFQWTFYSREHWAGKPKETAVHWTLTVIYGSWTLLYALAASR